MWVLAGYILAAVFCEAASQSQGCGTGGNSSACNSGNGGRLIDTGEWEGNRFLPVAAIALGALVICCAVGHRCYYRNDPDDLGLEPSAGVIDAYRELESGSGLGLGSDEASELGATHGRQAWGGDDDHKAIPSLGASPPAKGHESKSKSRSPSSTSRSRKVEKVGEVVAEASDDDDDDDLVIERVQETPTPVAPAEEIPPDDDLMWSVNDPKRGVQTSIGGVAASGPPEPESDDPVIRALQSKLARGVITKAEYDQVVSVLQQDETSHIAAAKPQSFKQRASYNRSHIRATAS